MSTAAAQHVSGFKVSHNGAPLDESVLSLATEIKVRQSLRRPSSASLKFRDPGQDHLTTFKIGDPLEVSIGATGDTSTVKIFKGEIVALEPEFGQHGVVVGVKAYDKSHRLQRTKRVRTFQQMSASDIVNKVIQEAGLQGLVDSTQPVFEFFQQSDETDRELIRRLERMHDMEFVIGDDGEKCEFRKAGELGSPAATLQYGNDLLAFRPRVSAVQQDGSVEVRGWDIKGKQAISMSESSATEPASVNGTTRGDTQGKFGTDKLLISDRSVDTTQEASALAKAAINRRAAGYFEAEGSCLGNTAVKAGATVQIEGVTSKYSGKYMVTSVTHIQRSQDAFKTHFQISGRSERDLLDLMNPPQERPWGQHMVVGVVTNNKDDEGGMGRVRVKYPSLSDNDESQWARVATLNAGKERGIYMLPQVGDEVVVAFENGDARRPLVVGSLYNGQDKPGSDLLPDQKGGFAVKSDDVAYIHTKEDLKFKSDKGMTIEVTNDQKQDVKGKVESKGQQVTMKSDTTYQLEAGSSMTIKGVSITVEASASLTLKGATVDIQGSGPVNIKGAIINIG